MHLSEGVLHTPILLAGAVLAVAGIAVGLRRLEPERLPLTALFAATLLAFSAQAKIITDVDGNKINIACI